MRIEEESSGYTAYNEDDQPVLSVNTYETTVPKGGYEEEELCVIDAIVSYGCTTEQEIEALKEIFLHIHDEFGRYPGIDNYFSTLDSKESQLIGTLIKQGYIPKQLLLNGEEHIADPNLSDKNVIKTLINSTTASRVPGSTYSGFLLHNSEYKIRAPRSFAKERTPQLLRQMASQLYHFCCSKGLKPTEIEIMYLNNSLFISANSKDAVAKMASLLASKDAIKKALTTPHNYKGCSSFDKKTSDRHAKKILSRVYSAYSCDDLRFLNIKNLLTEDTKIFSIVLPNLKPITAGKNIYFVCDRLKADRHAEENLMDILEQFPLEALESKLKPAIYGKKRPCFACHSRLAAISEKWSEEFSLTAPPFNFNPNKGLLFKNTADRQKLASLSATAASLGAYNSDIHVSQEGDSGYATISDSEYEDDEEINTLPLDKMSLKY